MASRKNGEFSRRRFFESAGLLVSGCGLLSVAPRLNAEQPFDSLPPSLWKNQRQNGLIMIRRPAPTRLESKLKIVSSAEPGEPLVVNGQVFAPDGVTPVEGITVYAYNTDAQGYYGEDRMEYPPRLFGWMRTDSYGKFELSTIRPGPYPNMNIPAHIHFSLWGAGYPLQWVEELRFTGDPYITSSMLDEDSRLGDFGTIRELKRTPDGALTCGLSVKLQRETNFR
jgi:protocatechuate 3,4-dioxygenase, beta subunit